METREDHETENVQETSLSPQTNPLTQQNLAFNQRLLEHQKRVADLQKQHLTNQKSKSSQNKVDVYMPPVEKGGSPTTILSGDIKVFKTNDSPVPEPNRDDSLPLAANLISHDPDLDVSIQNTDQGSMDVSDNRDADDVSLTLSCIPSRTDSLKQYPLKDGTFQSNTSSADSSDQKSKQKEESLGTNLEEDAGTQTSFKESPKVTREVKPTVDLQKLQKKREELRNQYPSFFNKPSTTSGPSLDMLSRIRDHREQLRHQREVLERRRYNRTMESSEEVLRKSRTLLSPMDDILVNENDSAKSDSDIDFKIGERKVIQQTANTPPENVKTENTKAKTEEPPIKVVDETESHDSKLSSSSSSRSASNVEKSTMAATLTNVNSILEELRNLQARVLIHQEEDELLKNKRPGIELPDSSIQVVQF